MIHEVAVVEKRREMDAKDLFAVKSVAKLPNAPELAKRYRKRSDEET
jgi:hypothetical protein